MAFGTQQKSSQILKEKSPPNLRGTSLHVFIVQEYLGDVYLGLHFAGKQSPSSYPERAIWYSPLRVKNMA